MTKRGSMVSEETIPVRVVEQRGPSVVVEYAGGLKRCIIPAENVTSGGVDPQTLEDGIPYGIPWEQVLTLSATPQKLADKLRANGIWTREDLEANPTAAFGALQAVYGIDLAALYQAAYGGK